MEEKRELVFTRPITEKDLDEINEQAPIRIVLKNTKEQNSKVLSKLSKEVTIVIKNDLDEITEKTSSVEYTPMELADIIDRFDKIDSNILTNWSDLEKATYLYISYMTSLIPDYETSSDLGLKSILQGLVNPNAFAVLYKEAMDRQDIPCRILTSDTNHTFNEIMIDGIYYPLDLFLDVEKNLPLLQKESRFELSNFLSDKEFYYKPENKIEKMTEEDKKQTPSLDHSFIQNSIDEVFHEKTSKKIVPPVIELKSKELKEMFGSKEITDATSFTKTKEFRIEFKDSDIDPLKEDLLKIGTYYPEELDNVILSNATSLHIDMQKVVDSINESKTKQKHTQGIVTPTRLVIESKNAEDFDLDFSKVAKVNLDKSKRTNRIDTTQKISFVNTSGKPMKMPALKGKIANTVDAISIKDFDVAGFNLSETISGTSTGVLSNLLRLELSGTGTKGVRDIQGLDKVIGLTINGIPGTEFRDVMNISIGVPNRMPRLFDLTIENQPNEIHNRRFLQEIKNPNIVKLQIHSSRLNKIDGLNELRNQLLLLSLQQNELSISQAKEISSLYKNHPYINTCVYGNSSIHDAIYNLPTSISDDTYNYLNNLFNRSGYIEYINMTYQNIPENNISQRKTAMLKEFLKWSMQNVPYYIEDAKIFREELPFTFNPMMIKDVTTFENYLNDPSNYFEQNYLRDGTLLLTLEQLRTLITSGKRIPQNINLHINTVQELDNIELQNLKQQCDLLGLNFSGIRVFDERQLNPSNPNERVFDSIDTHLSDYEIDEYMKIRNGLEEIVEGIDNSLSDVEKFAIIYYRLSQKIAVYDEETATKEEYSKEHAIYQSKTRDSSRNLSEGLISQEGFDLNTNSPNRTQINRCVCAGYADILKNALAMVGVEAIIDSGNTVADISNSSSPIYSGGHEWNKVKIYGKWYYADLCWDNGQNTRGRSQNFKYALRGANPSEKFTEIYSDATTIKGHITSIEPGIRSEQVEPNSYDRDALKNLFDQVKNGQLPHKIPIVDDPDINTILDINRIKSEYVRRKNDMYAKYYGDRTYQAEYNERATRFRKHEQEVTNGGITYRTIQDYPERKDDERFLILGEYKDALERMSKYEAGDTTVYSGTPDQIAVALEKDREYVTTRNYTFNQNQNAHEDLATLGKFGEKMTYIPRQNGVLRNIGAGILNVGIFARNVVAPVYRFIGKHIAQPIHKLITRNKDNSPYRNNIYHRMVARRDYFLDMAKQRDEDETNRRIARASDPSKVKPVSHSFRNSLEARIRAIFNTKKGNEAVLRAGAYDIRKNVETQEEARALPIMQSSLQTQINDLEREIRNNPRAINIDEAKSALKRKNSILEVINNKLNSYGPSGRVADIQTDAVSHEQHAIASKEVTTAKVTVIKGIAKGLAIKYIGPKLKDWLLERGKTVQEVDVHVSKEVPDNKWIAPVTKSVPETKTDVVFDNTSSLEDIMHDNAGKEITGFYSVWGRENGPSTYTLSGDEKITAIFRSTGEGGYGLSDISGLKAPTLVDGTFTSDLLDSSGVLNQNISIETLLSGVKDGTIDASSFKDVYLSIGDRFWVRAGDVLSEATKEVTIPTGNMIEQVITPGHWMQGTKIIDEIVKTTKVVDNPAIQKAVEVGGDAMKGIIGLDSLQDLAENLRKTTTNKKTNKNKNRNYNYDDGETKPIPTSKREYNEER